MLHLLKERNTDFSEVISYKTRPLRKWEIDGVDYNYLNEKDFHEAVTQGIFLEHAHYALYYYGTKKSDIIDRLDKNKIIIKEIEMQWIISISKTNPEIFHNSLRIFLDLSEETMIQRVTKRANITDDELEKRLVSSRWEKSEAQNYCNEIIIAEGSIEEVYGKIEHAIFTYVNS